MKMIRAGGVFNFREMIAHVNSNKKLQDFTMAASSSDACCTNRFSFFDQARLFNIALGR